MTKVKKLLGGCKGCAEACQTEGEEQAIEMRGKLEGEGFGVTGWTVLNFFYQKVLGKVGLRIHRDRVAAADSLLVITCGSGSWTRSSTQLTTKERVRQRGYVT